jgi:hypothetical protein
MEEDKSPQHSVHVFKQVFENRCNEEERLLSEEREKVLPEAVRAGRPGQYRSRLPRTQTGELSAGTAAYSNARNNLPPDIVSKVYEHPSDFGTLEKESRHGMHTYISDGTYIHTGYQRY